MTSVTIQSKASPNDGGPLPYPQRFALSMFVGALVGYGNYWYQCYEVSAEMRNTIKPTPYILAGLASGVILNTACLIYDVAASALGNREECEKLANSVKASSYDRLRQKVWKVISCVDKVQKKVDSVYSRIFKIQTEEEIRTRYATDNDYYLSDPALMEIFRRAVLSQFVNSMQSVVSGELGIYAVKVVGYTIIANQFVVGWNVLTFILGVFSKMSQTLIAIDLAKNNSPEKV